MKELVRLIHSQQENDEDIVITDRHILADRSLHLYGEALFRNCDIEIAPLGTPRFILDDEASVTFENCRFVGTLVKTSNGGMTPAAITAREGSTLSFIGCHCRNLDSFILSDGEVNMHNCEIIYDGSAVSGDEAYKNPHAAQSAAIGMASVRMVLEAGFMSGAPAGALLCRFISADSEDVELTDCRFDCRSNTECAVNLSLEHGVLRHCTLKGVYKLEANVLHDCTLEGCTAVSLQTEDETNEAENCRFINCGEIIAESADLTDCEISGLKGSIALENSSVVRCCFRNMTPTADGVFDLDSTELTDCTFENITLKNDHYLFDSDNDSSLDSCMFRNCRTTRDDLQLVSSGGYKGKLRKKWVEDDICSGCTGLDKVIHLESWEV